MRSVDQPPIRTITTRRCLLGRVAIEQRFCPPLTRADTTFRSFGAVWSFVASRAPNRHALKRNDSV
jgi:hypothetical protein